MLRLLADENEPIGLAQIAAVLGLAKGTAHGLLRTLQDVGFIEQTYPTGPYRVAPERVADVKALIGDATDGYGGVRGIGPAAGPDLVRRFGSLASPYDRIDEVEAAGVRNRLVAGRDDAFRCLDLATLRRGAPLSPPFDPEAGRVGGHDRDRLAAWLTAMGLTELLRPVEA
jgi:5'-3' exonuclease